MYEHWISNLQMTETRLKPVMACTPPPPPSSIQLGRVKNFRKVFPGGEGQGSEIFISVGVVLSEWGHGILKENLKLHNPSIKSIFRISSLKATFATKLFSVIK